MLSPDLAGLHGRRRTLTSGNVTCHALPLTLTVDLGELEATTYVHQHFFFFVCCFFTLTQESPNLSIKHSHLATRRPFLIQTLLSSSHTESRICDKLERVAHVSHNVMMCRLPQASHIAPQRLTDASARPSYIMHPTSTGNYRYPNLSHRLQDERFGFTHTRLQTKQGLVALRRSKFSPKVPVSAIKAAFYPQTRFYGSHNHVQLDFIIISLSLIFMVHCLLSRSFLRYFCPSGITSPAVAWNSCQRQDPVSDTGIACQI